MTHCVWKENAPGLQVGALRAFDGLALETALFVLVFGAEIVRVFLTCAALLANHAIVASQSTPKVRHVSRVVLMGESFFHQKSPAYATYLWHALCA